ncbi:hypothetical protein [Listeria booriae]|uniref:Uncharacterized protein n=1 Tax=Listeria booriae TaxID=1552123 RepID=A0A7X0YJN3_9LIST|nr:hypothetical protein [Listeria booriae]MBC2115708.1 hypothetical protein [Listeria booriae]
MRTEKEYKDVGYEFPTRIAFYLRTDDKGKLGLLFKKVKNTKVQLNNIKFSSLHVFFLDETVATPLLVEDVQSYEEMNRITEKLQSIWVDRNGSGKEEEA